MPKINQYGIFEGGACHKRLNARKQRAEGARMAWNDMIEMCYVRKRKGWYEIKQIQKKRRVGTQPNVNAEIGYLRMLQIVFPNIMKSKRKFRSSTMDSWMEAIASAEFAVSEENPLSIITEGEKVWAGLIAPSPNDDAVYEEMYGVKSGLLKSHSEPAAQESDDNDKWHPQDYSGKNAPESDTTNDK